MHQNQLQLGVFAEIHEQIIFIASDQVLKSELLS